jgi:hypothetical protein
MPVKAALCRACKPEDADKELENGALFVNLKTQF